MCPTGKKQGSPRGCLGKYNQQNYRIMETTNVNKWAMYSEIKNCETQFNCGFVTVDEFANLCYSARKPYIGTLKNLLLYIRDRWF